MITPSRRPIRRGGFFHFGGRGEGTGPISALAACLVEASQTNDLGECLLVLPEAFNVRGEYWDRASRQLDPNIEAHLHDLSVKFELALVAGIVEVDNTPGHGDNSAYLLDRGVRRRLSRKARNDRSSLYTPCTTGGDQVAFCGGISIGALICVDGLEFNANSPSEAQSNLLKRAPPLVVCIPSHTGDFGTLEVAVAWPFYVNVIVANSRWKPSVIRRAWSTDTQVFAGNGNAVCISALDLSPSDPR